MLNEPGIWMQREMHIQEGEVAGDWNYHSWQKGRPVWWVCWKWTVQHFYATNI